MKVALPKIPANLEELKQLPQAALSSPADTAALTVAAFMAYENNKQACFDMLEFLRGPGGPLSPMEQQFIRDRLGDGNMFVVRSFFGGTSPANDYTIPQGQITIELQETPYSYQNEGYAQLWLVSSGADSPRPITLRNKPSTGQWFVSDGFGFLSQVRKPVSQDAWA